MCSLYPLEKCWLWIVFFSVSCFLFIHFKFFCQPMECCISKTIFLLNSFLIIKLYHTKCHNCSGSVMKPCPGSASSTTALLFCRAALTSWCQSKLRMCLIFVIVIPNRFLMWGRYATMAFMLWGNNEPQGSCFSWTEKRPWFCDDVIQKRRLIFLKHMLYPGTAH